MAEQLYEAFGLNRETEIVAFSQVLSGMVSLLSRALQDGDFLRATLIEPLVHGWLADIAPVIRSRSQQAIKGMTVEQLWEMNAALLDEQAAIVRKAITDAGGHVPETLDAAAAPPVTPSGMYL